MFKIFKKKQNTVQKDHKKVEISSPLKSYHLTHNYEDVPRSFEEAIEIDKNVSRKNPAAVDKADISIPINFEHVAHCDAEHGRNIMLSLIRSDWVEHCMKRSNN